MNFNFDWNCVSAGGPYVTISELGLAFNQTAVSMLNNAENVVIGFDKDNLTIGIADAKDKPEIAKTYKFYGKSNSTWVRIGCKDFVRFLSSITGVSYSPAKRFIPQMDEENKIMYVTVAKESIADEDPGEEE